MHSSYGIQIVCVILATGLLVSDALPALYIQDGSLAKKSENLRDFMSAMRNSGRLRYGKRSLSDYDTEDAPLYPVRMMLAKRMTQNLPELIDSLNGAERLRFGK
ncbi:hypothetical protein M3Y98_00056400 [Aphelenchoides besseyi]|nr:hypothetical protein M3Y98_00056400 [Aphelenchoides besseyi]KAI6198890.1 hypothetical protein M3Y96_00568400 [Aphelenchoides besseyi]KAI6237917.1 hypothetical protein M3Y95_00315300 [Aphelenchoides besseyi]